MLTSWLRPAGALGVRRFSKNHHDVYAVPEDRIMPARTFPKLPSFAPISAVPDCYFSLKTEHSVALLRETDMWAHAPCFMSRSSSIVRPEECPGQFALPSDLARLLPLGERLINQGVGINAI